jgi:hypothetical protein
MSEHYWIIVNKTTGQSWSNEYGWLDDRSDQYDLFTDDEKQVLNLPIDGQWQSTR